MLMSISISNNKIMLFCSSLVDLVLRILLLILLAKVESESECTVVYTVRSSHKFSTQEFISAATAFSSSSVLFCMNVIYLSATKDLQYRSCIETKLVLYQHSHHAPEGGESPHIYSKVFQAIKLKCRCISAHFLSSVNILVAQG